MIYLVVLVEILLKLNGDNMKTKNNNYSKYLYEQITIELNKELAYINKIYEEHKKLNNYMLVLVKENGVKPNKTFIDLNNVADAQQQVKWFEEMIWKKEVLFKEGLREIKKLSQWENLSIQEQSRFSNTIRKLYDLLNDKNKLHSGQKDYIAEKYNYPNIKEYNEAWKQIEKPVVKIINNLIKINNKYNLELNIE